MFNSLLTVAGRQLKSCLLGQNNNGFRALINAKTRLVREVQMCSNSTVQQQSRWLRTSCCLAIKEDRRRIAQKPYEGVDGEKTVDIDSAMRVQSSLFPDENTSNLLFDGVRFDDLNVIHIKVTKNNTLLQMTDSKGAPIMNRSCGCEGFKNAKRGTNIAAQATGISLGMKAVAIGIRNVRIKIRGLGAGRMASVKGLQMAGMNIVSITDNTPVDENCPRPRKVRRI